MTNPIDIVHDIDSTYRGVVKFFSKPEREIQFTDASTLLLGLISINPPVNALAIAEFLQKWSALTILPETAIARDAFIAAVHQLYSLEVRSDGEDDNSV
jgi:hypothetical protein